MVTSNDIPLAANPIERAAHRRADADGLAKAFASPDVLILAMQGGAPLVEPGGGLIWLGPEAGKLAGRQGEVFLGEDKQGAPVFAIDLGEGFALADSPIAGLGEFADMRAALAHLPLLDANCASTARSLFEWHRAHGFCANCGAKTEPVEAGWKRACGACGREHWPRTDPVAIMLAERDGKCLLGRQRGWPAGFLSCLAGFVEPGESVEQAAARELAEESGIRADPTSAEYLFCQPWPFPSSLMIGIILQAETEEISVEQDELEAAFWLTRAEVRDMLEGRHPTFACPPPMAVAHHILKAWAARG